MIAVRSVIFGLVASGFSIFDSRETGFVILALMVVSMILPAFYFTYQMGYLRGQERMIKEIKKVIESFSDASEIARGINAAFGDIKPLEIFQKRGAEDGEG